VSGAGVLAFGDSITNGGGELQWGVALQSWALWVARALGLPFTSYAVDGARAVDVATQQIPAFVRTSALADVTYDLGCLYIGVNDVRAADWDRDGYEAQLRTVLGFLRERCERTLVLTAPLDLGRPPAGAKVRELNRTIGRLAAEHGALLLDLSEFRGRNLVMADHVHPTAFGQIAIAERALGVLAAAGLPARTAPSRLIRYELTWWKRLRGDAAYAYRHAKVSARAAFIRLKAALPPP
jgi:lysophospholipase L1-like esterase